jgi:hypothetical protein
MSVSDYRHRISGRVFLDTRPGHLVGQVDTVITIGTTADDQGQLGMLLSPQAVCLILAGSADHLSGEPARERDEMAA